MLIELVDALRCPEAHADAHLVASVRERRGRRVWTGTLGCPICRAEFAIVGGVAHFGVAPAARPHVPAHAPCASRPVDDEDAEADRAAALLHLAEPGGLVLLGQSWATLVDALLARCVAHYVLLDPPFDTDAGDVSPLRTRGCLPFAAGAFRAVALDAVPGFEAIGEAAARVAATRARVVLPTTVALPLELRRLAGDDRHVVTDREPIATAPVTLRRRGLVTD